MDDQTRYKILGVVDGNAQCLMIVFHINKMSAKHFILDYLLKNKIIGNKLIEDFKTRWNNSINKMYSDIMNEIFGREKSNMIVNIDYKI